MLEHMLQAMRRSATLSRNHRSLWWLGLLAGGGASFNVNTESELPLLWLAIAGVVIVVVGVISVASEAGLISGVRAANGGAALGFVALVRDGLRHFWRVIGVKLATAVAMGLVGLVALGPLALGAALDALPVGGAVSALLALLATPVWLTIHFVSQYALRITVLEEVGLRVTFRDALDHVHGRITDSVALLLAEQLGYAAVMLVVAALIGGAVGLAAAAWFAGGLVAAVVTGVVVGVPTLIFTVAAAGAAGAYRSAVWTLAYLED